jgi:5-hydroxyisourate hydrolase
MISITSHILDTSSGRPAEGVNTNLFYLNNESQWEEICVGITNKDGRISDFTTEKKNLVKGIYKINFQTGDYFQEKELKCFYPFVEIIFEIDRDEHYHIPLLISPFGYTTYRGS